MGIRPPFRSKSNSYTESCRVDAAGRWRERTCEYPGRSHGHIQYDITFGVWSKTVNHEKSAGVIIQYPMA